MIATLPTPEATDVASLPIRKLHMDFSQGFARHWHTGGATEYAANHSAIPADFGRLGLKSAPTKPFTRHLA
jgi:hypothetical protein